MIRNEWYGKWDVKVVFDPYLIRQPHTARDLETKERKRRTGDEAERRIPRPHSMERRRTVSGIEHVRSHTGVRGNEAADKLAALGAQIPDGHRIVERNSREPQMLVGRRV